MSNVLKHVAIIMDGNGRWAKNRNMPRTAGHEAGEKTVERIIKYCYKHEIPYLSLFAFSTENWSRSSEEVTKLFTLLDEFMKKFKNEAIEKEIRVRIMGDISPLKEELKASLNGMQEATKNFSKLTVNIGLNYGGRDEIVMACNKAIENGKKISKEEFSSLLYTFDMPDPDLVIRTSGEERISNFMIYQCAYSELYFTKVYWPDFDEIEMDKAIESFNNRKRRFGKEE